MRKLIVSLALLICIYSVAEAAPCYGTKMPQQKNFFIGTGAYSIFKRYLEDDQGNLNSTQEFLLLSYGAFDWLSIDLKGGAGDITQHSSSGDKVDYSTSFAGGYGLRLKFYDRDKIKMVFGFQHISVHPKRTYVSGVRQRAILDDWQVSLLASYDFDKITPYLGTRWSRVDYIHRNGEDHKRVMSDPDRSVGFIFGFDLPFTEKIWLNLEGQLFDSQALSASINYSF